jgi:hypothetical protein
MQTMKMSSGRSWLKLIFRCKKNYRLSLSRNLNRSRNLRKQKNPPLKPLLSQPSLKPLTLLNQTPLALLLSLLPKKLPPLMLLPKLQLRRNNDYGRHKSRTIEC